MLASQQNSWQKQLDELKEQQTAKVNLAYFYKSRYNF